MTPGEWIQVAVAAVLAFTLVGVLWYAREARRQAQSSIEMTREIREQRLGEAQPILIVDVAAQKLIDYLEWDSERGVVRHRRTGQEIKPWPLPELKLRVHNAGRGPAVSIQGTYYRGDRESSWVSAEGFLLPGDTCDLEITGMETLMKVAPAPWEDELAQKVGRPLPAGVAIVYDDIHQRTWVTYLDLDWDPGDVPLVYPLTQRFYQVQHRGHQTVLGRERGGA